MIRNYEEFKKYTNKKLALQVTSLALSLTMIGGLAGCKTNTENNVESPSVTVEQPVMKDFKLEDATVATFAKDIEAVKAATLANGFSVRELDVASYLTYQNIFNIKEDAMKDIIATYFEGEFDINEISANADGFVSQIVTQNLLNPVSKHMSINYNHDELDYLMYEEVEKQYLAIRTMFEDKEINLETRNKKFIEWLTALEKFYNEDGSITLKNDNKFDGVYYRASMSEGAEASIEYLGIEMSQWITNVKNETITSQIDAIVTREGENVVKIQQALNEITNSDNYAEKLAAYLETDYLTKEEIEDLKVLLQLYSIGGLADSIFRQCDFTDVQPAIIFKAEECTVGKTK